MKQVLSLVLLLCVGSQGMAQKRIEKSQKPETPSVSLQPVLGANYMVLSGQGIQSLNRNIGINIGLGVEIPVSRNSSIETGMFYSSTKSSIERDIRWGNNIQGGGAGYEVREESAYQFFRIPIVYQLRQKKANPFFAGVGTGMVVNFTSRRSGRETMLPGMLGEGYNDRFTMRSNFGIPLGMYATAAIGKEWGMNKNTVGLRLEYINDWTGWNYPTAGDYESEQGYKMKGHAIALNAYIRLK